jgi:hypothetical protein
VKKHFSLSLRSFVILLKHTENASLGILFFIVPTEDLSPIISFLELFADLNVRKILVLKKW